MKWIEFAGPPGVGKSAIDRACARHYLRPSDIRSQSFRVTAEWRDYFTAIDSLYAQFPDTERFRNGLFRDTIRASTMCINSSGFYLYSQFLTQHALRFARLYGSAEIVPRIVNAIPERPFAVILCSAPESVIVARNQKRDAARIDQSGDAGLYLEATMVLGRALANMKVRVLHLDTVKPISKNKTLILKTF